MSLFGEYPCINQTIAPSYISFTSAAISVPMCLFTIAGNLLVVLAIFMDPNKDLKSQFNYFVANLAISDLVVGFVVVILCISSERRSFKEISSPIGLHPHAILHLVYGVCSQFSGFDCGSTLGDNVSVDLPNKAEP